MNPFTDIPKTPIENMEYRIFMRDAASKDAGLRRDIMQACREDVLYFLNAWVLLHEPRDFEDNGVSRPKIIPFITWTHQDPVILEIKKNLGKRDIGIEKSRGEGMSWIGLMLALHQWLFELEPVNIGLVSSVEKKSDTPGNMDSLLAKLDWELLQLPEWMAGRLGVDYVRNKGDHTLVNLRNSSQITAFAATAGLGRGGRYTWFLMDELSEWDRGPDDRAMAATQQATKSRLVIATPLGTDGAYYKFMHTKSNMVKQVLDWKDNPSKNRGMYRLEHGKPIAIDPVNNPLPKHYDPPTSEVIELWDELRKRSFQLEGRPRSPWYDEECFRADSTPQSIAQELDRDYGGSVVRYFADNVLAVVRETVRPPVLRGEIVADREGHWKFIKDPNGPVKLWCALDAQGKPKLSEYVVCSDVATGEDGEYCSNSVTHVIDLVTKEQVLEYATKSTKEADFADQGIAFCEMFHDAYFAWEHQGPGVPYGRRILDRGYHNIYYRPVLDSRGKLKSKKIGFWNAREGRKVLFSDLRVAILTGNLVVRSEELMAELPQYLRVGDKIIHQKNDKDDASHGDRVISIGVGMQAAKDRPIQKQSDYKPFGGGEPPHGTLAWREWKQEQDAQDGDERNYGWDDRSTADLMSSTRNSFSGAA